MPLVRPGDQAGAKLNRDMLSAKSYKKWLEEKGFINVPRAHLQVAP